MVNLISLILGWNWRVRRLRKRWDRLREKSLKKEAGLRATLLPREDQIEQNLRILEERRLNRRERARLAKELEIDLEEVKALLQTKPEEIRAAAARQVQPPPQQKQMKRKEEEQAY